MACGHLWVARREERRQPVDDVDRAVLAAGAAHRDGEVAAVARLVLRNARGDELLDVVDQALHGGCATRGSVTTSGSRPVEVAQRRLPIGIGERARIEDEVGIPGDAVLEAEGLERDRRGGRRCAVPTRR